jgi:hypothetical protein
MRFPKPLIVLIIACALGALAGCEGDGGGNFAIRSVTDPNTSLHGDFSHGIYRYDDKNNLTVLLLDGPIENPTQAVTIRLMWAPHAGRTPIDSTATNATIHYVIFTGQANAQVGVYSGAGFVFTKTDPGGPSLEASVWQASLRLADKSQGFDDLLGQAMVKGGIAANRDDAAVSEKLRKLNVLLRQKLGYPRMVEKAPDSPDFGS